MRVGENGEDVLEDLRGSRLPVGSDQGDPSAQLRVELGHLSIFICMQSAVWPARVHGQTPATAQ